MHLPLLGPWPLEALLETEGHASLLAPGALAIAPTSASTSSLVCVHAPISLFL